MARPQTQAAIPVDDLEFGVTYGDFDDGTARKVVLLPGDPPPGIPQPGGRRRGGDLDAGGSAARTEAYWVDA